ncbi:hypothetical protein RFI_38301 [Reticulomyxa filosa]|uniref:GOLD domain-containing protein n=1 Tax=Reticulomyxa filosa TaxID=46433 RepID=X6LCS4_RETFI|nr:hypothetical protein RFI_38301 [Reticulomyxa filosa]|eukprot:ETN99180.1 hypothetical protein RFI_38301 [Reticulomyxa filosa]
MSYLLIKLNFFFVIILLHLINNYFFLKKMLINVVFIESKSIECYWHNMNDIKKILQFEYDVREGGDLDIGFSIFNPENNELFKRVYSFYKMEKSIPIQFQIEQEKDIGIYQCFFISFKFTQQLINLDNKH